MSAGALAAALGLCVATAGPSSATGVPDVEHDLLALLNAERANLGLEPVEVEPTLDAGAALHAESQAAADRLYHTTMTATAPDGWTRLGENVGVGPGAAEVHTALMASPSHRSTMLDGRFDYVGIGVVQGADGSHWMSMKLADHPSADQLPATSDDPHRTVTSAGAVRVTEGATFHGDLHRVRLRAPVVGLLRSPSGAGYWLVAADGGVFAFGDAGFHGSAGALPLVALITGMTVAPDGAGYWLVGADGGVFAFGSAPFLGSSSRQLLPSPIARINRTATGLGYALYDVTGRRLGFGDAR